MARELVVETGCKPHDQLDGALRVPASAFGDLATHPGEDVSLVRLGRRRIDVSLLTHADGQQPRMDAEHRDVVPLCFASHVLRQFHDSRLRHRIGGHQRPAEDPGLTAEVHDASVATGHHHGQHELRGEEGPADVHLHGAPPLICVDLPCRPDGSDDARVVDQDLDGTEALSQPLDGCPQRPLVGHVCNLCCRDPTRRLDELDRLGEFVPRSGDQPDGHPLRGEALG
jgi:hypothetical protein